MEPAQGRWYSTSRRSGPLSVAIGAISQSAARKGQAQGRKRSGRRVGFDETRPDWDKKPVCAARDWLGARALSKVRVSAVASVLALISIATNRSLFRLITLITLMTALLAVRDNDQAIAPSSTPALSLSACSRHFGRSRPHTVVHTTADMHESHRIAPEMDWVVHPQAGNAPCTRIALESQHQINSSRSTDDFIVTAIHPLTFLRNTAFPTDRFALNGVQVTSGKHDDVNRRGY